MASSNNLKQKLAANIKSDPDDSFSKFALALEFLKDEDQQKARLLFEDIYQNDPDYVGVYYHLGKLYEQYQEVEKALTVYDEGIAVASTQQEKRTLSELKEARSILEIELENE